MLSSSSWDSDWYGFRIQVIPHIWLFYRLSPFPSHRTRCDWSDANLYFLSWFLWPSHILCNSSIHSVKSQSSKAIQWADFLSPFDRPLSIALNLKSRLIVLIQFLRVLSSFWSYFPEPQVRFDRRTSEYIPAHGSYGEVKGNDHASGHLDIQSLIEPETIRIR
jgi:hypothetical protein